MKLSASGILPGLFFTPVCSLGIVAALISGGGRPAIAGPILS